MHRITSIIIIEDHQLFRECLESVLSEIESLSVVGSIGSQEDALETVDKLQPEVILIDSSLSDCSPIELTKRITTTYPKTKVLIVGIPPHCQDLQGLISAGATGYIVKSASVNDLTKAIDSLVNGEIAISQQVAYCMFSQLSQLASAHRRRQLIESMRLTHRELEILRMIAEGLSNKQIANQLCLSLYTVKNHVHQILEKLQVHDRWKAVEYAQDKEWLN